MYGFQAELRLILIASRESNLTPCKAMPERKRNNSSCGHIVHIGLEMRFEQWDACTAL